MKRFGEPMNEGDSPSLNHHQGVAATRVFRGRSRLLPAALLALLMIGARVPVIGANDAHADYWSNDNCYHRASGYNVGCLYYASGYWHFYGLPPVYGNGKVELGMDTQGLWYVRLAYAWQRVDQWVKSWEPIYGGSWTDDARPTIQYNNCLTARARYRTNCALP